jgi:hypothetical protein
MRVFSWEKMKYITSCFCYHVTVHDSKEKTAKYRFSIEFYGTIFANMFKEVHVPVQQSLAEQFRSVMTGLGDLNAAHISGVDGIDLLHSGMILPDWHTAYIWKNT